MLRHFDGEIREEAETVSAIMRRFAVKAVDSVNNPEGVDGLLRNLALKVVSRDQNWRAIFTQMRDRDNRFEQHKRVLIIKYLEYLGFRKKLLEYIYERKAGLEQADSQADLTQLPPMVGATYQAQIETRRAVEFFQVPAGGKVRFKLPRDALVDLMFGQRSFRLLGAITPCLMSRNGIASSLKRGRSTIGRHPESDIPIDMAFSDVSRAHAIIEWRGGSVVVINDLSARGTFISASFLKVNAIGASAH